VGLEAYAQWALNHHGRRQYLDLLFYLLALTVSRFARHGRFLYVMYDVIRLRKASLGHRLLVKRRDWNSTVANIESLTADQLREAADAMARKQQQPIRNPLITELLRKLTIRTSIVLAEAQIQIYDQRSFSTVGMPAFWLTINPSDLRDPIVLILGGVRIELACSCGKCPNPIDRYICHDSRPNSSREQSM
jgi:helitron helicase-like protein